MTLPLAGCRVIVTRERPGELATMLTRRGAAVDHVPLIAVEEPSDGGAGLSDALSRLADVDWLVVTSPAGAERVGAGARSAESPTGNEGRYHEERRWVMGTELRVVVEGRAPEANDAVKRAFAEAQRWDGLLSHYDSSSPLSRMLACHSSSALSRSHDSSELCASSRPSK